MVRKIKGLSLILLIFLGGCAPQAPQKAKVTIWHWMTDRNAAFQQLAKKYEETTGMKVIFDLYAPSEAYSQKVRAAAQGGNLPDIFGILGEKRDFAAFINAGHILDLTSYMKADNGAWENSFFEKALEVNKFEKGNSYAVAPGIYAVPIDITTIQMLYNKKLFKELGLNPNKAPQTFKEFLEIGEKIKSNKIQGLVSGWGEIWMIDCLASNYAFNIMGKEKVLSTIRGEVPYTDSDWIKVFTLFADMQESGILANGIVTMLNKNAEQLFANDKAVFAFNGSWCVNVYKSMNPALEYAVFLPPKVSDKYPIAVWGGAGSSFIVNARSNNKEEAVKFLKWLTAKEQQVYLNDATNNLPANKQSATTMSEVNAAFARGMDYAIHPNALDVAEFSTVIETRDRGIQSIILGEKTPEQVAAETQAVKERELARKRR